MQTRHTVQLLHIIHVLYISCCGRQFCVTFLSNTDTRQADPQTIPPKPLCFSSSPRMITGVIPSSVPTALISWNRNEHLSGGFHQNISTWLEMFRWLCLWNVQKVKYSHIHLRSDLYSSRCTVCPQYELPSALHRQHWRDTKDKTSLQSCI